MQETVNQAISDLSSEEFLTLLEELQQTAKNEEEAFSYVRAAVKERCKTDLEFFSFYYFPHYCTLAFNQIHLDTFRLFKFGERGARDVLAAPRGYAKSTFAVLIEIMHDLCFQQEQYIVIFSHTEDQAALKVKDIRTELLTNHTLTSDFGIKFETKKPAALSFVVYCGDTRCKIQAVGQNTELRGIRFGAKRPTKIVADDYEHSDKSLREHLRDKERNKYFEVVSKLGDPQTNIKYVGTVLHQDGLLTHLLRNPAYRARKYKAVISWANNEKLWEEWRRIYTDLDRDDRKEAADSFFEENSDAMLDGVEVLWPEKEDYYYLQKELVETGLRAFEKEKQNNPLGHDDTIFTDLHFYEECPEGIKVEKSGAIIPWKHIEHQAFAVIDPSTGKTTQTKQSDYTSIILGYKCPKGRLLVHKDWTIRAKPSDWIKLMFDIEESLPEGFVKFGVETNLYRELLLPNLLAERKRREGVRKKIVKIPFYDIVQTTNKVERITQVEPKVSHGWILFNKTLSKTAMLQLAEFPKGDHDDFPDALEMLWGLINNRYKVAAITK